MNQFQLRFRASFAALFSPLFFCLFLWSPASSAEISQKQITYSENGNPLIGYEFFDPSVSIKQPGVLVFSDWMGIGDFSKERAADLVRLGYRAFVVDIYGEGRAAKDQKEAGELATKFKSDRSLLRARGKAAIETFLKDPLVDPAKVGAIGFCFGGTAELDLARSGSPLLGVVSFHGGLDTPDRSLGKNIKARLLVLHGADDPYVPESDVKAFEQEMRDGKVVWELTKYSNTVHAFTNPAAGTDNSKGAAFNPLASARSFDAMKGFFREIFGN